MNAFYSAIDTGTSQWFAIKFKRQKVRAGVESQWELVENHGFP